MPKTVTLEVKLLDMPVVKALARVAKAARDFNDNHAFNERSKELDAAFSELDALLEPPPGKHDELTFRES